MCKYKALCVHILNHLFCIVMPTQIHNEWTMFNLFCLPNVCIPQVGLRLCLTHAGVTYVLSIPRLVELKISKSKWFFPKGKKYKFFSPKGSIMVPLRVKIIWAAEKKEQKWLSNINGCITNLLAAFSEKTHNSRPLIKATPPILTWNPQIAQT